MHATRGYAAKTAKGALEPFTFERRPPGAHDVLVEILFCGICHSDIHQARGEWGAAAFPMVPGHEIVGRVTRVGAAVKRFKAGDIAGVGCFVDSCRNCGNCRDGLEQYCERGASYTYNGREQDGKTPTFGGYSSQIVVDEKYVLVIPPTLPAANAAPLLCAGITTWSPLRHFGVGPGQRVGIVGLGGLGHMGVKFAAAFGADVTVFSSSKAKETDAKRLGAQSFVVTKDPRAVKALANKYDFILDTVSAAHDLNLYLGLLRRDGAMVIVGVPERATEIRANALISNRRRLAGSSIGGIRETQEMLDYCAAKQITSDVEVIPVKQVNTAYDRIIKGDVRYRFVIDMKTL
ncbi:MAG: NAD(P)-dependent alcohol dehydrogenase [Gemmatimonadales bacterium]